MSRAVVITDSTVDFPVGALDGQRIKVVPLYVMFGNEQFRDRVNLSSDEFFIKLQKSRDLPKTSQPTPADFLKAYKKDPKIISIHVSAKLSGTLQSANKARDEMPGNFDIRTLDSQTLSLGLGFLVMRAAELAEGGESLDNIEAEIKQMIPRIRLFGVLDTLLYLEKGGRIGKVSSWLGSLLQIKPIIQIKDGEVMPVERTRSKAKAIERLIEIFAGEGGMTKIGIIHAAAETEAKELANRLKTVYPGKNIPIVQTGTIIGTHSGPGLIGICGSPK
ncbi:MAG: DegV family protein [Candidatus Pacebacteria bacterium]|nr:DegV family protein [Candidatus Paceibacterota bacterium]